MSTPSPSSSVSHPPPEPPIILSEDDYEHSGDSSSRSSRSFLSHTPAPDSTIEVFTFPHEYQLHISLPGFTWEGITLATKQRRILHVVADRWDNNRGGHFERRVAFGYDADLGQVKADFNGELLRITIPRHIFSVISPRTNYAPMGRTS